MSGTAAIPDQHAMMIRLTCGHARIVDANLGGTMAGMPGVVTWCFECDRERECSGAIMASKHWHTG